MIGRIFTVRGVAVSWRVLKTTIVGFLGARGPFLASGLAFDVLLYCIPLLFLIVSVTGYFLAGSDRSVEDTVRLFVPFIPAAQPYIADNLKSIVVGWNRFGLIGCGLFFIFSTTMFGSARTALNILFDIRHPRPFLKGMGIDFLMTLAFSALFGLTIALISFLAVIRGLANDLSFLAPLIKSGLILNGAFLGFLFTTVLFYVLYRFCPARTTQPRVLWTASVTGAILIEISKWVFAWYVTKAQSLTLLYGTLSGLLFLFLWVYYAALVFLFSAAFGLALHREFLGDPAGPPDAADG